MGGEGPAGPAGATHDRRRRRRTLVIVALGVGAFAAAAFASSAGSVDPVVQGDGGWRLDLGDDDPAQRQIEPSESDDVAPQDVSSGVAGDVAAGTANALVVVVIGAALALLLYRTARLLSRVRHAPRDDPDDWVQVPADPRDQLGEAAADALRLVRSDGPVGDVIIACWLALEAAVGRAGVERTASETAAELTVRVLERLDAPEAAVRQLLALYDAARFSTHQLGESDRVAAVDALEAIHLRLAPVSSA